METWDDIVGFVTRFSDACVAIWRLVESSGLGDEDLRYLREEHEKVLELLRRACPIPGGDFIANRRRLTNVCIALRNFLMEVEEKCGEDITYEYLYGRALEVVMDFENLDEF